MNYPLIVALVLSVLMGLSACSTTTSDVREVLSDVERQQGIDVRNEVANILLAITGQEIQTVSQGDTRIYSLHHAEEDIHAIGRSVADLYGFDVVPPTQADYILELAQVVPDGGACFEGMDAVGQNTSYTISVLTFGLLPAAGGHCLVVSGSLYRYQGEEKVLMGEFESNQGIVEVYAGANEVDAYALTVTRNDEARALEASFGDLFNQMITEGAFY